MKCDIISRVKIETDDKDISQCGTTDGCTCGYYLGVERCISFEQDTFVLQEYCRLFKTSIVAGKRCEECILSQR